MAEVLWGVTGEVAVVGYGRHEVDGRRYVSLAGLRMRGWTGGMVQRLLGSPDRLSVDPRVRAAPQVLLFRLERVELAERGEEFRAVAEAAARKREEALERIGLTPVDVPRLDPGKLALRAVGHRARQEIERGRGWSGEPSGNSGGRASLDPWKVRYLRHRLDSAYDRLLDGLPGGERDPGRAEAVALLRRRICAAIAEVYPALAEECGRQAVAQAAEEEEEEEEEVRGRRGRGVTGKSDAVPVGDPG